ncbi:4-hydroxythreonine-4-phosphate dehydrogenase PdxA [Acuticoccus sp. M5D2P5]|uniref:4-hydroxythreonine-4-phosphate dehydrogenase PdxA n=1 Tax=Acuticoccus kalidii TaxID=2910977 RepID=UPI001F1D2EE4|nr:4-hydroxythreonine-4-phosphate dehydrogenase PdxA [Acuticoccus kalidii]MCF3934605.1 4-hydroxythreonine-4-phosphate dehydrogenase PdxA [Acuticoccus kalidii]
MPQKPVIAFAIGDPAAISPELAVRVLAKHNEDDATLLVLGDARVLDRGIAHAKLDDPGLAASIDRVSPADIGTARPARSVFVDLANCDVDSVGIGASSAAGGRAALDNFRIALTAANEGFADAVYFTPFNKHAMRLGESNYVDEIGFVNRTIGAERSGSEFNVLDEVWNARVTSHIPLSKVAESIDTDRIFRAIRLTTEVMEGAGIKRPRIGVAALNPHAGDGRNFGTEDEDVILPAVERAKAHQMSVEGPIPSDTVFVRAVKGEFDAVLTMFHDQGQIAMKLIGFDRGVTLVAGYPFPIATPAHGTAYDIAGQGIANDGAAIKAIELATRLARPASDAPEISQSFADAIAAARAAVAGQSPAEGAAAD